MSLDYTLAITSCDRDDLLQQTLDSFFAHADIAPVDSIVAEDGPVLPDCPGIRTVYRNPERLGQIYSCDKLMSLVETEWVFWCEDDWLFKEGDFIQPSYDILNQYPEIFTVGLRGRAWHHPLVTVPEYPFLIAEPGWNRGWGGMAFNPGLRRRSDYLKMGSYASLGGTDMYACQSELAISKKYLAAGYRIADLGRPIIEHLGLGRSKTKEQF